MSAVLVAEVCRDAAAFGALAADWDRLYRRCASATPFQSHAWLHSWWLSYGTRGRLRVILVHRAGELLAAAPMMRAYRPVPALVPLGGAITDFMDVLLADDQARETAPVLAAALARAAGTAVVDFREVRPGAAVEQVYAHWRGPRRMLADSLCLELPALPIDGLVSRLPSSSAQRARAKLRKLAALGVERRVVRHDETGGALRNLLELHRLQWQGRGITPEHLQPRFAEHLTRAVATMAGRGEAVVTEFSMGGTPVAADLTLLSPWLSGGYLYGAHPRLRECKADVAALLLHSVTLHWAARTAGVNGPAQSAESDEAVGPGDAHALSGGFGPDSADGQSRALGVGTLSLLRGDEPYKHHWRPWAVANRRLLLARRGSAPLLSATACDAVARARARELLRKRHGAGR